MKETIRQAVARVKSGQCSNEDKAIVHLLEQCKDLRTKVEKMKMNGGCDVATHNETPWYMQ